MRLEAGAQQFAKYLERIGTKDPAIHGSNLLSNLRFNIDSDGGKAILPVDICSDSEEEVIHWAYGNGVLNPESAEAIKDTSILTVLNKVSLEINNRVRQRLLILITLLKLCRYCKCSMVKKLF